MFNLVFTFNINNFITYFSIPYISIVLTNMLMDRSKVITIHNNNQIDKNIDKKIDTHAGILIR